MTDDLARLLDVQELDTAADVLRHRREHLPERAVVAELQAELAELEAEAVPIRERRHTVTRAQQALEDEIASLAAKADTTSATMYSGSVTNPRELQSLQQELDAIGRHRATLEDQVLEQMVEAEPLDAELAAVDERRAAVDDRAVAATAALAEAEAAIDAELADLESRRTAAVDGVDAGLLERYEKLRSRLKGVGIAKLDGTKCTGCHLALPAAEVEQVRRQARDEGVAICPECDRLLVV